MKREEWQSISVGSRHVHTRTVARRPTLKLKKREEKLEEGTEPTIRYAHHKKPDWSIKQKNDEMEKESMDGSPTLPTEDKYAVNSRGIRSCVALRRKGDERNMTRWAGRLAASALRNASLPYKF